MFRNVVESTYVINGKVYRAICEIDAPLPDVKEFSYQIIKDVCTVEEEQRKLAAQKEEEKKAEESSSPKVEELTKDDQPPEVVD